MDWGAESYSIFSSKDCSSNPSLVSLFGSFNEKIIPKLSLEIFFFDTTGKYFFNPTRRHYFVIQWLVIARSVFDGGGDGQWLSADRRTLIDISRRLAFLVTTWFHRRPKIYYRLKHGLRLNDSASKTVAGRSS